MKKLSKEIIELLSENMSDAADGPEWAGDESVWKDPIFANFKIAEEAHYGGEGKGEEYWTVYKLTDKSTKDDYFVKFDGYYMSYDGTTWQSVSQVKPVEVKKRDWEEV